jgi:hypothetical protein
MTSHPAGLQKKQDGLTREEVLEWEKLFNKKRDLAT